jgi:hypothetical protein
MEKLKLDLDTLHVDGFATMARAQRPAGTVRANEGTTYCTNLTYCTSDCTDITSCGHPCP